MLELQQKVLLEIPKHKEGTKERSFLEKFKTTLPTVKNTIDVLGSALRVGEEIGLNPETIRKLLGL